MQGLYVCGTPHMTIFSFASADKTLSVFALADLMETKGMKLHTYIPYFTDQTPGRLFLRWAFVPGIYLRQPFKASVCLLNYHNYHEPCYLHAATCQILKFLWGKFLSWLSHKKT